MSVEEYFLTKIGERLWRKIVTGDKRAFEEYARAYRVEVLYVSDGGVVVNVTSDQQTPSGYSQGDKVNHGDHEIEFEGLFGLEDFWAVVLESIGHSDRVKFLAQGHDQQAHE